MVRYAVLVVARGLVRVVTRVIDARVIGKVAEHVARVPTQGVA